VAVGEGDRLGAGVEEHEDVGDVAVVFLACSLPEVAVEGFLAARESGPIVVTSEPLDAVPLRDRHNLLGDEPVAASGRAQPCIGRRWVHQRQRTDMREHPSEASQALWALATAPGPRNRLLLHP